jgi:hypothetical protein
MIAVREGGLAINVEHLNLKVFASRAEIDLEDAIGVFHRWIQQRARPEMLVDVADYRHVPEGPGVLLIGHEANYSLDQTEGRLGLLYNRKAPLAGDTAAKLAQAVGAALAACQALEAEPPFSGKLRFDAGDCEVIVNDRLIAPNTTQTWDALRPELERFFAGLYGEGTFRVERRGEPRERFRVGLKTSAPVPLAEALSRVAGG